MSSLPSLSRAVAPFPFCCLLFSRSYRFLPIIYVPVFVLLSAPLSLPRNLSVPISLSAERQARSVLRSSSYVIQISQLASNASRASSICLRMSLIQQCYYILQFLGSTLSRYSYICNDLKKNTFTY